MELNSMEGLPLEDTEEVKIGDWIIRLPSDICTNRDIFNDIFSLDTWNNVFRPEQREKILQKLPPELLSQPEAAQSTMEDLLSGKLKIFSKNPLDNFFEKLEQGGFDPEVIDYKQCIMREWKKESLRQLKSYHYRLFEDIIVSRQKHLSRLKSRQQIVPGEGSSFVKPQNEDFNEEVKDIKEPGIKLKKSNDNLETGIQNTKGRNNVMVKRKLQDVIESSEGGPQSLKKIYQLPVPVPIKSESVLNKAIVNSKFSSLTVAKAESSCQTHVVDPAATSLKLLPSSSTVKAPSTATSSITREISKNSIQAFNDPPHIIATSTTSKTSSITSVKPLTKIIASGNAGEKSFTIQPAANVPSFHEKASPILASKLQSAPQVSFNVDGATGLVESLEASSITLNYQSKPDDKSSEDDLETSSDEFEAIEPTIGFDTSLGISKFSESSKTPSSIAAVSSLSSSTGVKKSTSPLANIVTSSLTTTTGTTDKFVVASSSSMFPTPLVIVNAPRPLAPTSTTIPVRLQMKDQDSFITFHNNQLLSKSLISQSQVHPTFNTKDKAFTAIAGIQGQLGTQLRVVQSSGALTTSSGNLLISSSPIVIAKPTAASKNQMKTFSAICSPKVEGVSFSSAKLEQAGLRSGNEGLQFLTQTLTVPQSQSLDAQLSMLKSTSGHSLISEHLKSSRPACLNSAGILSPEDMNLSLGNLGIGLGMNLDGLDTSDAENTMKLEIDVIDKIDDLSVLDGNPFDSIPNLSDELDGLDLDLVDGLCDFEGLVSEEKKYSCFFSLLRDVLCSTRDHRMNLMCLEKTIRKWSSSSIAASHSWFLRVADWNNALVTALNFLAGSYQDIHPEDFVPYIEYKYKTKFYQWIGAGRDGDNNLNPLCSIWMENLDKLPSIKKLDGETEDQEDEEDENEDSELTGEDAKKKSKRPQTPPPPRCITDWSVRPTNEEEKAVFRRQERSRFDNPHKAFTYKMHGYESVVGPVKGVYSSQIGMTNKARGHSLLVDDRPPYVTILALVRDAVARLPNGEGTRSDICEMLRDSAFLAPDASNITLNSVVSGALDRLHYERDPCVRYDSHKKSWIYLHRDRTQEQFERLHHNRSYTKSTKCRNSTTRKARKTPTRPQPQTTSVVHCYPTKMTVTAPASSTNAAVSTTATFIKSEPSVVNDSNTKVLLEHAGGQNLIQTIPCLPSVKTSGADNVSQAGTTNTGSDVVGAPISIAPTIRYATISGKGETRPISAASLTGQFAQLPHHQHFILQPNGTLSASPQSAVQIRTSRPIQVSSPLTTTSGVVETSATPTSLSTTGNTASGNFTQGQFLLSPNAVLRLGSSLRLSGLRLPAPAANANNPGLRLPQHRILLTRSTVPGQPQAQGVLLGQTSTGQTVILSTAPPGSLNSLTSGQGSDNISYRFVTSADGTITSLVASTTMANSTTSSAAPAKAQFPKPVSFTGLSSVASPICIDSSKMQSIGVKAPVSSNQILPVINQTIRCPITSVANNTIIASTSTGSNIQFTTAPLTTDGNQTQSITSPMTSCVPTIQIQTMPQNITPTMQNILSTFTTGTDGSRVFQPSQGSPFIIRSGNGDFVFPTQLALGRGAQGIKLISLPMGNKTVLAKILPPGLGPRPVTQTTLPQSISPSSVVVTPTTLSSQPPA